MARVYKALRYIIEKFWYFISGIPISATIVESRITRTTKVASKADVRYSSIGRYTYIGCYCRINHTDIGAFSSIAPGVFIGGALHPTGFVSTSPIFLKGRNIFGRNFAAIDFQPYQMTNIGNDVWIGAGAIVLAGVSIGDGAIVGAGSVVTKDVLPYHIVAGNPARFLRSRMSDEIVTELQSIKWWESEEDTIISLAPLFGVPADFIKAWKENAIKKGNN